MSLSVLLIGKRNDFYCSRAVEFVEKNFSSHQVVLGERGAEYPREINDWTGDYIISYLSPWIIPRQLLERAEKAAINFHPGPPEYPGIGCTNFAIYDEVEAFSITCHHMDPRVDEGQLIAVKRFPLYPSDSVWTLTQRCYGYILQLFYEMAAKILAGEELPGSKESWTRKPFKRKELNDLCRITPDMSVREIRRRVRAVTFPGAPGAYIEIDGLRFDYTLADSSKTGARSQAGQ